MFLGHFGWGRGGWSSGSANHTEIPAFRLNTWVLICPPYQVPSLLRDAILEWRAAATMPTEPSVCHKPVPEPRALPTGHTTRLHGGKEETGAPAPSPSLTGFLCLSQHWAMTNHRLHSSLLPHCPLPAPDPHLPQFPLLLSQTQFSWEQRGGQWKSWKSRAAQASSFCPPSLFCPQEP